MTPRPSGGSRLSRGLRDRFPGGWCGRRHNIPSRYVRGQRTAYPNHGRGVRPHPARGRPRRVALTSGDRLDAASPVVRPGTAARAAANSCSEPQRWITRFSVDRVWIRRYLEVPRAPAPDRRVVSRRAGAGHRHLRSRCPEGGQRTPKRRAGSRGSRSGMPERRADRGDRPRGDRAGPPSRGTRAALDVPR